MGSVVVVVELAGVVVSPGAVVPVAGTVVGTVVGAPSGSGGGVVAVSGACPRNWVIVS